LTFIFVFVADRNVFVDAYLVSGSENGYKAKSRKSTTICCGFCFDETTTYGGFLCLEIVSLPQGIKTPGFPTGDVAIKVWFSSACTNMGGQAIHSRRNARMPRKTGFRRNSRQTKKQSRKMCFLLSLDCFMFAFYHIGTQKVVNW